MIALHVAGASLAGKRQDSMPGPFGWREGDAADLLFEQMKAEAQIFAADGLSSNNLPLPPGRAETITLFQTRKRA